MVKIKIVNKSNHRLPEYATPGSSGMDLKADIYKEIGIKPGEMASIPTGLFVEMPVGYEMQIRPKSGLAFKYGISVTNAPGTIDSDYRGEILVSLVNHSKNLFIVQPGMEVAQAVFAKYEIAEFDEVADVKELSTTERGDGGLGSTGLFGKNKDVK